MGTILGGCLGVVVKGYVGMVVGGSMGTVAGRCVGVVVGSYVGGVVGGCAWGCAWGCGPLREVGLMGGGGGGVWKCWITTLDNNIGMQILGCEGGQKLESHQKLKNCMVLRYIQRKVARQTNLFFSPDPLKHDSTEKPMWFDGTLMWRHYEVRIV